MFAALCLIILFFLNKKDESKIKNEALSQ